MTSNFFTAAAAACTAPLGASLRDESLNSSPHLATSSAIPSRPIGRADGPDRTILGLFTKKVLVFCENQPAVQPTLIFCHFAKKILVISRNQPAVQHPLTVSFAEKTSNFVENNPKSMPFNGPRCHPLAGP
jgi:hypothetical protein